MQVPFRVKGEAGGGEVRSLIGYSDLMTYGYDYDPRLRELAKDMWECWFLIYFIKN